MKGVKLDRFVLLLIAMILLAWWLPGIEQIIPLGSISTIGISGIFFLYGLKLSPSQVMQGLSNWRLHIVVQFTTFLLFPLLVIPFYPMMQSETQQALWLAVFFLAVLPSTVSSSVVMVSIARGNIPGAIFNASISGLIGIFVTPVWMGLFLNSAGEQHFSPGQALFELTIKILLPVMLGLLLHRFWGDFANRHKKQLTMFDKTVILIIVYKSFSMSFSDGVFEGIGAFQLMATGLCVIALFSVVYGLNYMVGKKLSFSQEDLITSLFCGSKKSLVHGTVFSAVLFSGMTGAGLFLVPIMIYHAFQLFIISIIAQRYAMRRDELDN